MRIYNGYQSDTVELCYEATDVFRNSMVLLE